MNDLIERLRLGDGTSPDHLLLLEAADALEKSVAWYVDFGNEHEPTRWKPWVGLTNEEIEDCFDESCHLKVVDPKGGIKGSVNIFEVGKAIENKLKERNT